MAFRWRTDDGPLLWYLDPLSPHQLQRHEIIKKKRCQSQNFLDPLLLRERERERERETERQTDRDRERERIASVKLFHIILTFMFYKQLSVCTLLLCDVK